MPPPIAPNIRDLIISWAYEGMLADKIAARLLGEYGVQVAPRSVNHILQRYRAELADVTKGIIRQELQAHLHTCISVFVETCNRAGDVERRARAHGRQLQTELLAQRQQMEAAAQLLHLAGADQPDRAPAEALEVDDDDIADVRASLLVRVEQMIAELKSKAANGAPGNGATNGHAN